MRIIYFDAVTGISGDMILSSLIDAGANKKVLQKIPKLLKLKNCSIVVKKARQHGLSGYSVTVNEDYSKKHRTYRELKLIIKKARLDEDIKIKAAEILEKLVLAEAKIHGESKETVTFHEIGKYDTLIDIIGTLICLKELKIDKVYSSPLPLTRGFINTAHGKLPLPAPATLNILKGFPVYSIKGQHETVTPTGAAIITSIADKFSNIPAMKINSCGYGFGSNKFNVPNFLRVIIGEVKNENLEDNISLIETNIDDMNPKYYDYVMDKLFKNGALDVFLTPVIMKKNRPAIIISVLCKKDKVNDMCDILFKETTTIGVRITDVFRKKLPRKEKYVKIPYGKIKVKTSYFNGKPVRIVPDYDTCRKIAEKTGIPLRQIITKLKKYI